jgi:hypothetical protein
MGRGPATALIEIKAPDLSHIRRENLQIDVDLFTRGRLCPRWCLDSFLEIVMIDWKSFRLM